MKNFLKHIIICICIAIVALFFIAYGIDMEVARRDYVNSRPAKDCIFDSVCHHFNHLDD